MRLAGFENLFVRGMDYSSFSSRFDRSVFNMRTLLLILVFSFSVFGQAAAPISYSSVFDIRHSKKVFVKASSASDRETIAKALSNDKELETVERAEDAEFIFEKKSRLPAQVYYFKDKAKIVVWTEFYKRAGLEKSVDNFLEILSRNRNLD